MGADDPSGQEPTSRGAGPAASVVAGGCVARPAKRRGWWRQTTRRLSAVAGPIVLSGALQVLGWTVRMRLLRGEELLQRWARGEQVILAFWHNRVVLMPLQCRGQKICIMNSQHRDGEIASQALTRWGIRSVRGSTTRGGVGGFLNLVNAYRQGWSLAVVPDGPRGPRCQVKAGVVHLARVTGAPIFPVSYAASRRTELRSWDRLVIPLPFARVVFMVGEPLRVPRDAADEAIEALRLELEQRLNRATADAEAALAA